MTTYLVPCGISALDALRNTGAPYPATDARAAFLDAEERWRAGASTVPEDRLLSDWADAVGVEAWDARLNEAEPRVCAETQTLWCTTGLSARQLLDRGDRIVLLASDTAKGVGAALCVAFIMTEGDLPGIGYTRAPDAGQAGTFSERMPAGAVTIVRITGLRPRADGVRTAVAALGHVMHAAEMIGGPLEVHLTAGYKVTLLHMMAMTELLYSTAPDRVSAWYVYEETGSDAIGIGMRCFSGPLLRSMREELTNAYHRLPPGGRSTFRGQLWRTTGESTALTDFGVGFLAVLGGPAVFPA